MTVHQEACIHLNRVVQQIHNAGMLAGVSLNPATPVTMLKDIICDVDLVLLMSVNPGFGGQKFIVQTLNKVRELRQLITLTGSNAQIEIDGGVNDVTGAQLAEAGADIATNSLDDVRRACDYAHQFGARIYATVNTLVYDSELMEVERLISDLYRIGVDALIVQDMALLRMDLPPIALHASTQCDLRTPQKARFLEALGFSQLVMARELTLDEIAAIREATTVPLEAFVHGALCVSYSGRCAISQVLKGRSANRGECAQLCRLPYDLIDERGHKL